MDKTIPVGIVTEERFPAAPQDASTNLSPYEQEQQQESHSYPKPAASTLTASRVVTRIVWAFAAIIIAFYANAGYVNFAAAESAPQQAAAAGWACFQVIVPYVVARAIAEILTA